MGGRQEGKKTRKEEGSRGKDKRKVRRKALVPVSSANSYGIG